MRRLIWVCAVLMLAAASGTAQSKTAGDAAAAVRALEDKWTEAARKNDVATIDGLLADNVAITSATGDMRTKSAYLAETKSRKYDSARIEDTKVTVFGDTAIATGVWRAKGTDKGKPFEDFERFTDTWAKAGGQWKCIATHSTPVKPTK